LLVHSLNSGNLGVGALTVSNIALVSEAARAEGRQAIFTVIGPAEPGPVYVTGAHIAALPMNTRTLFDPQRYWRTLGQLDAIIDIGGGDSFAGIYGAKRFGFLWLTKMFAVLRGKPLLLAPQTIGPFDHQPWRWLAGLAMNRAKAVVARDPMSYAAITEIAPNARRIEAIDVAFVLPFARPEQKRDGIIRVGINVSGLLFHGGYEGNNGFGLDVDYAALMTRFMDALLQRRDVEIQLITHVVSTEQSVDDDAHVADLLAARDRRIVRVPDFGSPSAAKSHIAGLDLLVAGRMHACIAAFSSGVPVVPVAYSRKFTGLFEGVLGYRHGVPVKGVTTESALSYLLSMVDQRDMLATEIAQKLAGVEAALDKYRAELRSFLRDVA
jgi:colanic acid/amylovoran biosynthesis protein